MRIMIIDDEPKIRNGLFKIIHKNYDDFVDIVSFSNAILALEYLESKPVDLIICDIKMPRMNGLEMIEKLRKENISAEIIILSGYSSFEYAQKAIELKVRKYMTKPTDIKILFKEIDDIIVELELEIDDEENVANKLSSNLIVSKCIEFIENNYSEKLTLKFISEELYVSPNYLCRLFKKEMNINLFDYIHKFRMEKAKVLLDDLSYKIFEIATIVGYSDTKYFSSLFKKMYNCTPIEYRNRIK